MFVGSPSGTAPSCVSAGLVADTQRVARAERRRCRCICASRPLPSADSTEPWLKVFLGVAQSQDSDQLSTIVAYHGTCGCFTELLTLSPPCVVILDDYQVVGHRKLQLLRSSVLNTLAGNQSDFPPIALAQLEELVQRDGTCPVLTGQVFVQRIRVSSNRGVYPVCSRCKATWVSGEDPCGFCGSQTPSIQLIAVLTLRSNEGADVRTFCDLANVAKIWGLPDEPCSFLRDAHDLEFMENIPPGAFQVVLTEKASKFGALRPDVLYNVEHIYHENEIPPPEGPSSPQRRRRRR